ncbi:MAG TPA: DUF6544 family protein [Ramlibacter sp.]
MAILKLVAGLLALGVLVLAALQLPRAHRDGREAEAARARLLASPAPLAGHFDPAMVAGLPEPARRFFLFAIEPGTRLASSAEIRTEGELSLGSKEDPKYMPMRARQVLAAPEGLVWEVETRRGILRIAGSDGMAGGRSWTRFWLWGVVPVARVSDDPDHLRSAFGRVVAEAAFWTPSFLLPRPGVSWSAVDPDTARATVRHGELVQEVDIHVAPSGQPLWVRISRWSNANPDQVFRLQPFGGELSDFRLVSGYRVPFRVDGGNFFGTPDYFPFYRARVLDVVMR